MYSELGDYIDVLSPCAQYLNTICDFSAGRPHAHNVFNMEQTVLAGLKHLEADSKENTWKRVLAAALLAEFEAYGGKNNRHEGNNELYKVLRFLVPSRLRFTAATDVPTGSEFQRMTFFRDAKFPQEWDAYVIGAHSCTEAETQDPSLFWDKATTMAKYPTLAPFCSFLTHMPIVATACDMAISVEGLLFSSRQTKINKNFAGRFVAGRINLMEIKRNEK